MDPVIRKQVIPLWIGTAIGLLIVSPLFAVLDPSYWVGASVGILIAAVISTSLQIVLTCSGTPDQHLRSLASAEHAAVGQLADLVLWRSCQGNERLGRKGVAGVGT